MTGLALTLRHLVFTGPSKAPASVEFGAGLNVIYGASETGKSFILESIDFMMGGSAELRDIPERVGYDRIFLGVEDPAGQPFTLARATVGGKFSCYEGLHQAIPAGVTPVILNAKSNPTRKDNVSAFLLEKIGLEGKRIKKNAQGDTNNLSLRNLVHFCLIPEGTIQKRESPIETGQFLTKTPEMSIFKLLLTGVDDSAVVPIEKDRNAATSRTGKIEIIDDLVGEYRDKLAGLVGEEDDATELADQLSRLENSVDAQRTDLQQLEFRFSGVVSRKRELKRSLDDVEARLGEIEELKARFALLGQHYESDLERLKGLQEAGTLFGAIGGGRCPLCGAAPEHQHLDEDCDGNVEQVVQATGAESAKVRLLQQELQETIKQLDTEADEFDRLTPTLERQLAQSDVELAQIAPTVQGQRATYSDLFEKRSQVSSAVSLLATIADLQQRKIDLEASPSSPLDPETVPAEGLSASVLDEFSEELRKLLEAWSFPETERVHFDRTARDFVISGKPRGSRGKGMRAITHSAFTVALLEHTLHKELPHPGYVVLDTPLLAYREPEHDDDDLSQTDIRDKFYDYLSRHDERQVIILENATPPKDVVQRSQTTFFTKNEHSGRYGFFPKNA